jgi:hypothetical protein
MADEGGARVEAGRHKRASRDPQVFVLLRELSEVHLLLDNVSANPANTVSEHASVKRPRELDADWVEKVCQISWPPDGSEDEKAEDAALLIRAKDYLNRLCQPASGATIAFTVLVTQGGEDRSWLRRKRGGEEISPTRNSLAQTAYPDLIGKAAGFRYVMWWISACLVAALIMTCALSWYVAYGNAALAELATARETLALAQTEVNKAEAPRPAGDLTDDTTSTGRRPTGGPGVARTQSSTSAPATRFVSYCAGPVFTSSTQAQLCGARDNALRNLTLIEQRLASWTCWRLFNDCVGEKAHEPGTTDVPSHAAELANILGSAVLPFLYGLLGAGAAIIRTLSRRIKASLLSPRDLLLSVQQLALGAVVGACIGLFVSAPGSDASGENLLGPVTLSASAISFVAGFGVESVFQALEALITRIFNISAAPAANGPDGRPGR